MALVLKINAVDRSNHVLWKQLVKTEVLTKEVDRLEFSILKTPSKTIPKVNQEVTLTEGATKIFGGLIIELNERIEGGILIGYQVRCKDFSQTLDRKLVQKNYESQTARQIVLNIITTFSTGFTTNNVATTSPTVTSIRFNYEQISRALTQLADLIGWDWYVDYDKDIHFFDEQTNTAPFNLDDTNDSYEWKTLEINETILELKNSIIVRGGEYKKTITEANAEDKYSADGTERVFFLAFRYDTLTVKKAGAVQTVGIDQQDDPLSFDVLYNPGEQFIKWRENNKPTSGQEVLVSGDVFIPIISKVRDQVSINTYGEYQDVVMDKSIESINEAHTRAKAELTKWASSVFEGSFKTTKTGLRTGQAITVKSTIRGTDKTFKINKIIGKARKNDQMEYEVFLLASGQVTFTDIMVGLLGQERKNIEIVTNEVLQRLETFIESATITEDLKTPTKNSPPYVYGPDAGNVGKYGFSTWG